MRRAVFGKPVYRLDLGYPDITLSSARGRPPLAACRIGSEGFAEGFKAIGARVRAAGARVAAVLPDDEIWRGPGTGRDADARRAARALGVADDEIGFVPTRGRGMRAAMRRTTLDEVKGFLAGAGIEVASFEPRRAAGEKDPTGPWRIAAGGVAVLAVGLAAVALLPRGGGEPGETATPVTLAEAPAAAPIVAEVETAPPPEVAATTPVAPRPPVRPAAVLPEALPRVAGNDAAPVIRAARNLPTQPVVPLAAARPDLAGISPRPRPVRVSEPVAPEAAEVAPEETGATIDADAPTVSVAMVTPPTAAGPRPRQRPAELATVVEPASEAEPAAEPARVQTVTVAAPVAAVTGLRPAARPDVLASRTVSTSIAAAVAEAARPAPVQTAALATPERAARVAAPPQRPAAVRPAAPKPVVFKPAPATIRQAPVRQVAVKPAPVPKPVPQATVAARPATPAPVREQVGLARNRMALIGVFGTSKDRRAVVRMPNGSIERVRAGDRISGARVAAIDSDSVRLSGGGRDTLLRMP